MTVDVVERPAAGGYRSSPRPAELVIRQRMHGGRKWTTVWNVAVGGGVLGAFLLAVFYALALGMDPIMCAVFATIGGAPLWIPILWMTYPEVRRLFNTTTVRVTNGGITVRTGPVPPRPRVEVRAGDIEQLGVVALTSSDPTVERWYVYADMEGFRYRRPLIDHLPSEEHARHLEQLIERYLRIEDETE